VKRQEWFFFAPFAFSSSVVNLIPSLQHPTTSFLNPLSLSPVLNLSHQPLLSTVLLDLLLLLLHTSSQLPFPFHPRLSFILTTTVFFLYPIRHRNLWAQSSQLPW
jgi:hypothetical protein